MIVMILSAEQFELGLTYNFNYLLLDHVNMEYNAYLIKDLT